jgi:hypothetical protein
MGLWAGYSGNFEPPTVFVSWEAVGIEELGAKWWGRGGDQRVGAPLHLL